MDEELDRRLIEIESRVAYLDDTVLKLKQTVVAHQTQLYQLETRYDTLLERVRNLIETRNDGPIPNEKPPHY